MILYLCSPRGFCAGVERAVQIVEKALLKHGPPVYVRHEIVHNRHVIETLLEKGAIFVEELDEVPEGDFPVIFSAHGVSKSVQTDAVNRNMTYLDATCPLVSKVHIEANVLHKQGYEILLIGHAGHPEVIGTMGQLPPGQVTLIQNLHEAKHFTPQQPDRLSIITQTTLSIDDTDEIINLLKGRFPSIKLQQKEDICYATTNRQNVVKKVAPLCDAVIVVGAPNSSNSQRLCQVAEKAGCKNAFLIQHKHDIDWSSFCAMNSIGLTAGASAPENLVQEIIEAFRKRYEVDVIPFTTVEENVFFKLPRELRDVAE
ncbi:MAG: 4-hydroxy-3-methylbut-2-enyl diphosphate reductase [Alphaproteobacteria bacterium]|nr:4-hydroxy-3-methylbut-2-enyl diphosphate reductase [Alphaproteobacteria bacterium]